VGEGRLVDGILLNLVRAQLLKKVHALSQKQAPLLTAPNSIMGERSKRVASQHHCLQL